MTNTQYHYFVELNLPEIPDQQMLNLIPEQRDRVGELMLEGVMVMYSLTADQRCVFACIKAKTVREVKEIIRTFPLYEFMQVHIHPLEFFHTVNASIAMVSLN